jgi:hypothetical protein
MVSLAGGFYVHKSRDHSDSRNAPGRSAPPAGLALDAGHGIWAMRWADTFLGALAIMVFAAIGAMLVHSNLHNSIGFGAGIFVLAGAFMLYRISFWHD